MFSRRSWSALAIVLFASTATAQYSARDPSIPPGSGKLKPVPTEPVGGALCFGDGSGSPCPNHNPGLPGHGCNNSLSDGGAILFARGRASVSYDEFNLFAHGMPPKTHVIFFQATIGFDAGRPFGNGLTCVGGTVKRIGTMESPDGNAMMPQPYMHSLSDLGCIPDRGGTRYYQVIYRDRAAIRDPTTRYPFNTTNAWMQVWVP